MFLYSKHEFEKANLIKSIDQILKPLVVLLMFIYYKNIDSIFYGQLIVTIISLLVSANFLKFNLPIQKFNFSDFKVNVKSIYQIGFFIYLQK